LSKRNYTQATRAALVTLSRGACYYPGCGEAVIRIVEDEYYTNYHIAHIRGANETGARHDKYMTDAQRDAFSNLLLLCLVHHTRVDGINKKDYKPETLHKWKADREADGQDALAGLTRLTEEDLQVIIIDAFQEQTKYIVEVLDRLEQSDKEAADLLRKLLNELQEFREYSTLLDPDSATKLYHASLQLAELDLGGNARQLSSVRSDLVDTLPAVTAALKEQIDRLGGMEGLGWD
jgi:hypothetical protein